MVEEKKKIRNKMKAWIKRKRKVAAKNEMVDER